MQVEIDLGDQSIHIGITLVLRNARQSLLGLLPLTQLDRQQGVAVQRVAIIGLRGEQAIHQATRLSHGAHINIQARKGESCPGIVRIITQGGLKRLTHGLRISTRLG